MKAQPDVANHQATLDAERAVNEQYRSTMERMLAAQPHLTNPLSVTRSQVWTTSSLPRPGVGRDITAPVIGRVALEDDHPYSDHLGQTLYVAGWRVEEDDFETVNWAAPIAGLFFEGRSSGYELAPALSGVRTFVQYLDDLIDFSDEIEDGQGDPFVGSVRDLNIPEAPTRRRPRAATLPDTTPTVTAPIPPESSEVADLEHPSDSDGVPRPGRKAPPKLVDPPSEEQVPLSELPRKEPGNRPIRLRAESAVQTVMELPKEGRMGSILPTMQPDQYRLVAAPADRAIIVQGQPGTGKTVIAAHRAVYLSSTERADKKITRIGVLGPSEHYVGHIAPSIAELREPGADIEVRSLPDLLRSICGLGALPKPGITSYIDSSWKLGQVIDQFIRSMPERPEADRMELRVRMVVEALTEATESDIADTDVLDWLRLLPKWTEVAAQARLLPMLATIALALDPRAAGPRFGHLIIDEAQDVRPLEWRVLTNSLLDPSGALSIFGDMNQRRSDWTAESWQQLAVDIEVTDEAGRFDVHELETGYRSTRQILKFANQLLPRSDRQERALRDGPSPVVTKVTPKDRTATAIEAASSLGRRHSGTVALITADLRPIVAGYRKREWKRGKYKHSWNRDDLTVIVLHPDQARGLEFDAAVVVEPGDFPENVGRQGVLYTSLTRANKELTVIHSKRLPGGLRQRRGRATHPQSGASRSTGSNGWTGGLPSEAINPA
jgi:DNA helicase-2/ATP-dependent DNA helicase PcrA